MYRLVTFLAILFVLCVSSQPFSYSQNSDKSQLVRPGQVLLIEVENEQDLTGNFVVDPTGQVDYPLLGKVFVDGLRLEEIGGFLRDSLSQSYLVNPKVKVSLVGAKETKKDREKKAAPAAGQVKIEVAGEKDLSGVFDLDTGGNIAYPILGQVPVGNLNSEQIRVVLAKKLGENYLVDPKITVQWLKKPKNSSKPTASQPKAMTPKTPAVKAEEVANVNGSYDRDVDFKFNMIRAGDKLKIEVFQEKDMSTIYSVGSNGKINFPILGEVYVEGLLLDELESYLEDNLKNYLIDPQITVSFAESLAKSVSLLGPVSKPGNYNLTPDTTLIRLISEAGGFSGDSASINIRLTRVGRDGKEKSIPVDFRAMMDGRLPDMKLEPKDVIYVEDNKNTGGTISILGQISRPGNYPPTHDMTLIRMISQAGGFTPVAAASRVRIVRAVPGSSKKKTIQVNANAILDGHSEDAKIEPGDIIVVPESFF